MICDENREDKKRVCFWASEEFLSKFNQDEYSFEFLNIADHLDKKPIDSDYINKHPAYAAYLTDKYNYLRRSKPYADNLKEKIDDYLNKNSCDSLQKIYEEQKHLDKNSTFLESFGKKLNSSILLDLFGKTLDPLFLLSLFEKSKTDIIIVNWDAINNDPVYSSDRAFQFFSHYRKGLDSWVKEGGIFILEAQSGQWILTQESYQLFDKKIITSKKVKDPDPEANKNTKLLEKKHPILHKPHNDADVKDDYSNKIALNKSYFSNWSWFPKKIENKNFQAGMPNHCIEKLYQGWFEKYKNEWDIFSINWEPLIFADKSNKKKPIMLCSIRGNSKEKGPVGAYILTTMYLGYSFLGSSFIETLIKNIFGLANNNALFTYYYVRQRDIKIKKLSIILVIIFFVILFRIIFALFYIYSSLALKDSELIYTIISAVISAVVTVVITPGITKLFEYISHVSKKF